VFSSARGARLVVRPAGGASGAGCDALSGSNLLTVELSAFGNKLLFLLLSPINVKMRMIMIAPATVQTQMLLARPVRNIGSGCNVVSKLSGLSRLLIAISVSFVRVGDHIGFAHRPRGAPKGLALNGTGGVGRADCRRSAGGRSGRKWRTAKQAIRVHGRIANALPADKNLIDDAYLLASPFPPSDCCPTVP
jgi:hypothetical protein